MKYNIKPQSKSHIPTLVLVSTSFYMLVTVIIIKRMETTIIFSDMNASKTLRYESLSFRLVLTFGFGLASPSTEAFGCRLASSSSKALND